jgi:hypothetical protein
LRVDKESALLFLNIACGAGWLNSSLVDFITKEHS